MDINFVKVITKEILKRKFPNDSKKQQLDEATSHKRIDIACPICGDSKNNSTKKRGNIYIKSKTYKCWNCGHFSSLNKFLLNTSKKLSINLSSYFSLDQINTFISEADEEIKSESDNFFKETDFYSSDNPVIRQLQNKKIFERLFTIDDFKAKLNLISLIELNKESKAYKFLESRCLTEIPIEFTSNFIYADSSDSKIYSFNIDINTKKVIGVTIRPITYKKYIICNYDKIIEDWFKESKDLFNEDELVLIGNINQYWNILNVNFKERVYVAEGTFDYPFVYNSLCITGVNKGHELLNKISNYYLLLDNDKEGILASIEYLKNGKHVFLWKKLLSKYKNVSSPTAKLELNKIKDINDAFKWLFKWNKTNYVEFNKIIQEFFSNNKFDLLFL